jgi:hypothetical protein
MRVHRSLTWPPTRPVRVGEGLGIAADDDPVQSVSPVDVRDGEDAS